MKRSCSHRSERSSNEEKPNENQIQRFKKKKKKLFHRKRTRKKEKLFRKYSFQSLGNFPKTQERNYKIVSRDLKSILISVPGASLLFRTLGVYMERIKVEETFQSSCLTCSISEGGELSNVVSSESRNSMLEFKWTEDRKQKKRK